MKQNVEYHIALLGFGTVGKGVYEIIKKEETEFLKSIDIKSVFVRGERIAELSKQYDDVYFVNDINEIINDDDIDIVIEVLNDIEPAFSFAKLFLQNGKDFITSNKLLIATKYDELKDIINNTYAKLCYEASVCGGVHIFHSIYDTKNIDNINYFIGIVNGTTNYILSQMKKNNKEFDDVLQDARQLGFVEKDSSNDIDGLDSKYKALLLNNFIFEKSYNLSQIINFGIRNIRKKDIQYAGIINKTIKLIAVGDYENLFVIPMFLDENDTLANVDNNLNAVEIYTNDMDCQTFIGQGAGSLPTAHGIILDLYDVIEGRIIYPYNHQNMILKNNLKSAFYISYPNLSIFDDIKDMTVDNDTIITKEITINEIYNRTKDLQDIFIAKM